MDIGEQVFHNKCPVCGSEERFLEGILKDMKEQGLVPANVTHFDFQQSSGSLLPKQKTVALPVGTEIPFYSLAWDICDNPDCGCMYATVVQRPKAVKSLGQPRLIVPGGGNLQPPVNLGNIRNN